jgi:hypothetical protein
VYHTNPLINEWKFTLTIILVILGVISIMTCYTNHQREKQLFLLLYALFLPIKQKLFHQYRNDEIWNVINKCKRSLSKTKPDDLEFDETIHSVLQDFKLIEFNPDGVPIQVKYQLLYQLLELDIPPSALPAITGLDDGNRKHERYKTGTPAMVLIKNKNGEVLKGSIIDISRGGVCVHCETPVELDEVLLLEIYSTNNYYFFYTDHLLFTGMGTVVRSWEDQTSGFAIIFDDIIDFSLFTKKFVLSTPYLIKYYQ